MPPFASTSEAEMSVSTCASRSSRNERSDRSRNTKSRAAIVTPKKRISRTKSDSSSRALRLRMRSVRRLAGGSWQRQAIAPAAQRFNGLARVVRIELPAQPAHEHLDHIAVAFEVLIVQSLGQFGL